MNGQPPQTDPLTRAARVAPRRTWALVPLGLTASLALAGCTQSSSGSAYDTPGAQSTAQGLTVAGQWPLTGMPASGKAPKHPVMVVKIDNSSNSSPQIGLSKA